MVLLLLDSIRRALVEGVARSKITGSICF